ncbi:nitrite reductase [Aliarcobacter trophiarum LMG 25534]|uniref:Nitrite reductase n=1 Tax=Aliarcobacter trophiarum LMG 25534 TaxID=1032241 RepID=A0AAD0QIH9_9BACT|nr:NnrS family protein [Aliarcobacter trophiarum]AXK48493.1 NnrS family protein [Aliarcobacter trophiarum LMG 25534]RXJ89976.1 nitrite reductase [Aliarcobacter trophiarum LMG 25534]
MIEFEKQYATNHYAYYPKGDFPIYLAYGFRPIFLLLAPYIVLSIILWAFVFAGYINLPIENTLNWHIYEMVFGVGTAMIVAFFLTGLPELFPGVVPIIGRHLAVIVIWWVLGRVSFWFMDYLTIYFTAIINISLTAYIGYLAAIPSFKDRNKKHVSLAYSMVSIVIIQILFFLSVANIIEIDSFKILLLSISLILVLILLALRRVSMESINELLEQEKIDETFLAKSFRYNLVIFCLLLYGFVEFFFPENSTLAYICFAVGSAILGVLNDFKLKDNFILNRPFVLYIVSIIVLTSIGFFFLGFNYLLELHLTNHFRHFITTGSFGLVFYVILIIVSTIHTGREIFTNLALTLGLILIILATFMRAFIPYFLEYSMELYILSSIIWAIPFIIYMKIFFPFLLDKREDGIKG